MKFDDLDAEMRVFETANDFCVLPGIYMVARLDGRSFTALTKKKLAFEAPFDERFRDAMMLAMAHVMKCGFRILFGYTQSDEISLLLHRDENLFDRKLRKLESVMSGEASAAFSLQIGVPACFDCRISQLPNEELVVRYFRWRQEDATRNALNAHCYWALRREGATASVATEALLSLSVSKKNELLFSKGVNFNNLPEWQRRGSGLIWRKVEKEGMNRKTGEPTKFTRRELHPDFRLPVRDAYEQMIRSVLLGEDKAID
jgi:tRNA(His) 5'-end guanylyltransferase